jgi:hypothetical protein
MSRDSAVLPPVPVLIVRLMCFCSDEIALARHRFSGYETFVSVPVFISDFPLEILVFR